MNNTNITQLKSIDVKKFRGLENINVSFGERITVICGKNGTSKSTILGIIAQAFSFRTDYAQPNPIRDELKQYKTIPGKEFESNFSEHFRLSSVYDKAGDMDVKFNIFDGSLGTEVDDINLKLYDYSDRPKPRPVLRGNNSRNITHPVIFLSLKRLLPISKRDTYEDIEIEYINNNADEIIQLNNRLLIKTSTGNITATKGTVDSMVIHTDKYDKESVSVGEDNTGQIIESILSFKKLKEEYPNYHGGILLIDEADAGLFPAAQIQLIKILSKKAKDLNLQIILTSHSPTLIQEVYELQKNDCKKYKVVYLTDSYGPIEILKSTSWLDIESDLKVETIALKNSIKLPRINIYFEDNEACNFFNSLVNKRKYTSIMNRLKNITLGCDQYLTLYKAQIPEFNRKSIIILDGDKMNNLPSNCKTILSLPGIIPPDQLLFEFLYNLPANDLFFVNHPIKFNKKIFEKHANFLFSTLQTSPDPGDLNITDFIKKYKSNNANVDGIVRQAFKDFYKSNDIQNLFERVSTNPFIYWANNNKNAVEDFNAKIEQSLIHILANEYGVPKYIIESHFK